MPRSIFPTCPSGIVFLLIILNLSGCAAAIGLEGAALRTLAIRGTVARTVAGRAVVAEGVAARTVAGRATTLTASERILIAAETEAVLQRTMTMQESLAELTNLRAIYKPGQNPQLGVLKNSEVIPFAEILDSRIIRFLDGKGSLTLKHDIYAINAEIVNVREFPTTNVSNVIRKLRKNQLVLKIDEAQDGWYRVFTDETQEIGYINGVNLLPFILLASSDSSATQTIFQRPQAVNCPNCEGHGRLLCKSCDSKGYDNCDQCQVKGYFNCTGCKSNGFLYCMDCSSNGYFNCQRCSGNGYLSCLLCAGNGYLSGRNGNTIPCIVCAGKGHKTCKKCKGEGTFTCQKCDRKGILSCMLCKGQGIQKCSNCSGDGIIRCQSCRGNGDFTCSYCRGYGAVTMEQAQGIEKIKHSIENQKSIQTDSDRPMESDLPRPIESDLPRKVKEQPNPLHQNLVGN